MSARRLRAMANSSLPRRAAMRELASSTSRKRSLSLSLTRLSFRPASSIIEFRGVESDDPEGATTIYARKIRILSKIITTGICREQGSQLSFVLISEQAYPAAVVFPASDPGREHGTG